MKVCRSGMDSTAFGRPNVGQTEISKSALMCNEDVHGPPLPSRLRLSKQSPISMNCYFCMDKKERPVGGKLEDDAHDIFTRTRNSVACRKRKEGDDQDIFHTGTILCIGNPVKSFTMRSRYSRYSQKKHNIETTSPQCHTP